MAILTGKEVPVLSIVTTCKGRLGNLKKSFASVCDVDFGGHIEYVIVDFDCPDEAGTYFKSVDLPELLSLTLQFVSNKPYFQPSLARNIGAVSAVSDYLLFIDADTILTQEYVDTAVKPVLDGTAEYSRVQMCRKASQKFGTLCLPYDLFATVRGYDASLHNWGKEDEDIYRRLMYKDCVGIFFDPDIIGVIEHDNDVRTRFYEDKRIASYGKPASNDDNATKIQDPNRAVNPNGFGRVETETQIRWKAW